MNYLADFKTFYFRTVLPNTPSYSAQFNINNFDQKIEILIDNYRKSYNNDPFEVVDIDTSIAKLEENLKADGTLFSVYSQKAATDVPKYLLLTHFTKFLKYYNTSITFPNFQEFVNRIHQDINSIGRSENFIRKFREARRNFAGHSKIVNQDILFGNVRGDYWTINLGAEKEIQYHMHIAETGIKYGLGFNLQGSQNNNDPIGNTRPFKESFYSFRRKIDDILKDYKFVDDNEEQLKNLNYNAFILYGYEIPYTLDSANYIVRGLDYLKLLYDLKNKQFKAWKIIFENSKQTSSQLENITVMNEFVNLLEYKKQIILQGPPGTGKTREAIAIAKRFIEIQNSKEFDINEFENYYNSFIGKKRHIKGEETFYVSENDDKSFKLLNVNKNIEVKVEKTDLLRYLKGEEDILNEAKEIGNWMQHLYQYNKQVEIIQFHPSYTYEDFVKGIISKPSGTGIIFEAQNKLLAKLAKDALKNWEESKTPKEEVSYRSWVESQFPEFVDFVTLEKDKKDYLISENVGIIDIDEDAFRYTGINNQWGNIHRMPFKDIIQGYIDNAIDRGQIKRNPHVSGSARQHSTYYIKMVNDFRQFLEDRNRKFNKKSDETLISIKNYVLIIDEINRANLSSVLGELVYALEYRGESVDSIYEVDNSNKLILPPNLYIIGTMNTADRSVGHIDYAIRRRFAFVDILPKDLSDDVSIKFDSVLFNSVKALFTIDDYTTKSQYLSNEFEPKDVALGHSYFIDKSNEGGSMQIRLEYEIKPILREYVKDGVLIGDDIIKKINDLNVSL